MRTPLKWHGGKSYLAKWIIEAMPAHTHYAEPYFGGGSVLFAKSYEGISEAVNDINGELINFWRVLQEGERSVDLMRRLSLTPLSEQEYLLANEGTLADDPIVKAWRLFVRYRQSRQALGSSYCSPTRRTRRGMNEQVSAWLSAVDMLPEAAERLRRVEIRCGNALDFIMLYDHEDCLFYLDPPYLQETRVSKDAYGDDEMSYADHVNLLALLSNAGLDPSNSEYLDACKGYKFKGKFLLSGYSNEAYESAARLSGWNSRNIVIDAKSSSQDVKPHRVETLWMNY